MSKKAYVQEILGDLKPGTQAAQKASAYAPSNIALVKYWGKREGLLNLPLTGSLSISLADRGVNTSIEFSDQDQIFLNGKPVGLEQRFASRLIEFLDLFRPAGTHFKVETESNLPIMAGLASSAAGFAALTRALDKLFHWELSNKKLSLLARLGSGSACRSIEEGFVEWYCGKNPDGLDSFAERLPIDWPEFRIGLLIDHHEAKSIGSREAMNHTVKTSALYESWPKQVAQDLKLIKKALESKNFSSLGETTENNALAMHATMISAKPSVLYWKTSTLEHMQKIWQLRQKGLEIYFTEDAGPNLKCLFLEHDAKKIQKHFPLIEIVSPFGNKPLSKLAPGRKVEGESARRTGVYTTVHEDSSTESTHKFSAGVEFRKRCKKMSEQIILVNEKDEPLGHGEKLEVHQKGLCHRAFSVFVFRTHEGHRELLLQQREASKYHSGGLWTNTCCGHPRQGEEVLSAAKRRLQEEMGLALNLKPAGVFHYIAHFENGLTENEVDHVFVTEYRGEAINPDPAEIMNHRWVKIEALEKSLVENPKQYTPWFLEALLLAKKEGVC